MKYNFKEIASRLIKNEFDNQQIKCLVAIVDGGYALQLIQTALNLTIEKIDNDLLRAEDLLSNNLNKLYSINEELACLLFIYFMMIATSHHTVNAIPFFLDDCKSVRVTQTLQRFSEDEKEPMWFRQWSLDRLSFR